MTIPRNLLDEIDRELLLASDSLVHEAERLVGLIELNRRALAFSMRLGRPLAVTELLDSPDSADAARIARLLRLLRASAADCRDETSGIS